MNKTLLTALASVALSWPLVAVSPETAPMVETPETTAHHQGKHHATHHGVHDGKTAEELITSCEQHMAKLKESGASLPVDMKAEFDYNLEIAEIEIKALKDLNHKDSHRHAASCHRHLSAANVYVKKHARLETAEKRKEEHKAKAEERKAKAGQKKAAREAEKAKGPDHGRAESAPQEQKS